MGKSPGEGEGKDLTSKLEKLMAEMKDWERKPLVQVGKAIIELVKLPKRETAKRFEPEKLALHIRLSDSFKGIFIVEYEELKDVAEALGSRTVDDVAKAIDVINRKRKVIEYEL